ncbi:MAG: hypothetical protein MRY78_16430 [Saprospiraceae bacterium]|nr:hypothetical protein [Saprospiraceae bacterium]
MKTIIPLLCFVSALFTLAAQDTVSYAHVAPYVTHFTLENGQMQGSGAELLQREFAESQFVCLGEYHGSQQLGAFTSAVLRALKPLGFEYFAAETGPYSAQKLMQLAANAHQTEESLFAFNEKYYQSTKEIMIPFFTGKEDAQFLAEASKQGYQLWGLDQEFLYSCFYLFDELLALSAEAENIVEITEAHRAAYDFAKAELEKDQTEKRYPFCKNLLSSTKINAFFNVLDSHQADIALIIEGLKESWEIYANYYPNRNQNLEDRAKLMKRHFAEAYRQAQRAGNKQPKVFIKMGSYHTMRGNTPNSVYDIGNMVHEIANLNQTKDLNIGVLGRFFFDNEENKVMDNLDYNSQWVKNFTPFYQAAQQDAWTIIDLRKLKYDWINGKYIFNWHLKNRMESFDLLLIPPVDYDPVPNYTVSE